MTLSQKEPTIADLCTDDLIEELIVRFAETNSIESVDTEPLGVVYIVISDELKRRKLQ